MHKAVTVIQKKTPSKTVVELAFFTTDPYVAVSTHKTHGDADKTVPYKTAEIFTERMREKGNRCELVGYEGQGHGFFNANRRGDEYFKKTVARMDEFLASLGYLEANSKTDAPN